MNIVSIVAIALGMAGVSQGAGSNDGTSSAAAAGQTTPAETAVPSSDKKICKYQEELGSKLPKRVCMTRADWDAQARAIQDQVNTMQRKSKISNR